MYAAEKAFDFKCNSTTKEKVVKTVADNFTKEEIDKIGSQRKPVVTNESKNGDFRAFLLCWIGAMYTFPCTNFSLVRHHFWCNALVAQAKVSETISKSFG